MSQAAYARDIERSPGDRSGCKPAGGTHTKAAFGNYLADQEIVTPDQLSRLPVEAWRSEDSVGRISLFHGLIDALGIMRIITQQEKTHELFGQIAVQQGHLTEDQLKTLLAGQSVRACVELAEELALAGHLELRPALKAVVDYLSRDEALDEICSVESGKRA
jgi:hypothetical protein